MARRAKSARNYPAAGVSVTGWAARFRSHKTSGARDADRQGQDWEDRDRAQDRKGPWYRSAR
ncbi:hypothetical protein [Streptomyces phaeochromogenes]|uniref:hypothetical protein n=1 Tax=Streptomyces phaeochromogenes TaxID=1923 RepID=UPI00386D1ABA|nr:hypothetical protein OG277_29110 [Streptomyces phaeochromogenes]